MVARSRRAPRFAGRIAQASRLRRKCRPCHDRAAWIALVTPRQAGTMDRI